MIKPEQRTHVIKAYVTKTRKAILRQEHKKRGIGMSELINIALYDYFNPTQVPKRSGIVKIDRTPKGSITLTDLKALRRADDYRGVMVELKHYFTKKRRENDRTDRTDI